MDRRAFRLATPRSRASVGPMRIQSWTVLVLLGLAPSGIALAENPFSFAATPGKLPKDVVPRHYAITLRPDAATLTTEGEVTIELEVLKPTAELVFNANELEIPSVTLDGTAAPAPKINAEAQIVTVTLPSPLTTGRHALHLTFRGKIQQQPVGLYVEKYRVGGVEKQILGTQMEPTDARRMFPCWDEPVFRASFQLTVTVPPGQTAVSNTQISRERPLAHGIREVSFAATPSMASYLMVLCVGEFEQLADEVDGVKLGVWTTQGKREQGRYAMEATKQIVHFYNDYFGVRYPLSKLDQIAIPGGFGGAMENWGGITYNESVLLFDPATSSQSTKETIFAVVAHEIAHQWFGNLVTMAWWDNLWLNEGFASWMGTKCTDRLNPSWQVWTRANGEKEAAMSLDARRGTHPIQQPVLTESAATDAFDEITYLKGQGFIRMLENYLGEADFRSGIRAYMAQHAYGSTTTADLWAALEKASGKPVSALAAGWTTQPGFPVVSVATRAAGDRLEIRLAQEHFTVNDPAPAALTWKVPISVAPLDRSASPQTALLEAPSDAISLHVSPGAAVKINVGNTGFYRASYSAALAKAQAAAFATLPEDDRVNLISDAWAMVESGRGDVARYLELVSALGPEETSLAVWSLVTGNLGFLLDLERGTAGQPAFERWMMERLRVPFARLGWEAKPGEPTNDGVLRALLLTFLGLLNDPEVVVEARARFARFLDVPASLAADLRTPVCTIVGRHAGEATWEKLRDLARATESTEEKDRYYQAFQGVTDPALARRTLELALAEDRPFAQWFSIVPAVAQQHPAIAWDFARAHAAELIAKVPEGGAFATRNTYFGYIAAPFSDADRADELEAFVVKQVGSQAGSETAKVAEKIRFKAAFKAKQLPKVDAWIGGWK